MKRQTQMGTFFMVSILALSGVGISYAGLTDEINVHGTIQVGTVELELVSYSENWLYKDLEDDCLRMYDAEQCDPNLMYISKAIAYGGQEPNSVEFVFDNIAPNVLFKADFIFHYIGTLPALIDEMTFTHLSGEDFTNCLTWTAYRCDEFGNPIDATGGIVTDPAEYIWVGYDYQLHNCMYIHVDCELLIPQDDYYAGLTGEFTGKIHVMQFEEWCPPRKIIDIPEETVKMKVAYPGGDSYFNTELSTVPAGYDVTDGIYDGWCIDLGNVIYPGTLYDVDLYCSLCGTFPTVITDEQWHKINWIVNNKQGAYMDIQYAIWYYANGEQHVQGVSGVPDDPMDPDTLFLVANADGTFIPGPGQWLAVICDAGPNTQLTIIEVDP